MNACLSIQTCIYLNKPKLSSPDNFHAIMRHYIKTETHDTQELIPSHWPSNQVSSFINHSQENHGYQSEVDLPCRNIWISFLYKARTADIGESKSSFLTHDARMRSSSFHFWIVNAEKICLNRKKGRKGKVKYVEHHGTRSTPRSTRFRSVLVSLHARSL